MTDQRSGRMLTTKDCASALKVTPQFIRGEIIDKRLKARISKPVGRQRARIRVEADDFADYCAARWPNVSVAPPKPHIHAGVYFVGCAEFIKIGVACDLKRRWSSSGTNFPFHLDFIGYIPAESGREAIESALHKQFAGLRYRGEWFRAGASLLAYISEHARPWPK